VTGNRIPTFQLATPDDLSLVMSIIAEAAAWHEANGIDQWPSPPNEHWWRRMAGHIARGEVYLAFLDGHAMGTVRLSWSDPYWPNDSSAGYVHQMAIRNSVRGTGLGAKMLAWTVEQIRQAGKSTARLDCQAGNRRLRRYYLDQGFIYQGQIHDRDYTAALFEKKIIDRPLLAYPAT
jgi:GNAT superfamily N-acetyltransferase